MADFAAFCLFILVYLQNYPALASYCFGTYNTYYYSFYCLGTCCGTNIRYCCNDTKNYSDAIIAAVVVAVMIVILVIITICLVVIKKCNRQRIQPGIVISTTPYISRDNMYPVNTRFSNSFQLPAYSPARDPPKYVSTLNLRAPIEENISQRCPENIQNTNTNIITSAPPSDQILDSEL